MMDVTDEQIKKALVSLTIQKILTDMGEPVLEQVHDRLYKKYQCFLPDCYEHPEYLKSVLQDLYGNLYSTIEQSIKTALAEFSNQKPFEKFLVVLGN